MTNKHSRFEGYKVISFLFQVLIDILETPLVSMFLIKYPHLYKKRKGVLFHLKINPLFPMSTSFYITFKSWRKFFRWVKHVIPELRKLGYGWYIL